MGNRLYRVAWQSLATEERGHGPWVSSRDEAQGTVDRANFIHAGILHRVESKTLLDVPNAETAEVLRNARAGENTLRSYATAEEMLQDFTRKEEGNMGNRLYSDEMITRISDEARGKTVESLEWIGDSGGYWALTFTDGSEMNFRFMAEIVQHEQARAAPSGSTRS